MLSDPERRTLAALCDAIVPSVRMDGEPADFYKRSATDMGVDKALATVIESKLDPYPREQIRRLLRVLESRPYNLLLNASSTAFSRLDEAQREALLMKWRDSGLGIKRSGFQGLKKLVLLLFYSHIENGSNPNWNAIGYPGPDTEPRPSIPAGSAIAPLNLSGDTTLECDVLVIGSGAGGSVIAYELSKAGHAVLVVEAGSYSTAGSFGKYELSGLDRHFMQHGLAATKDFAFILLAGRGGGGGTLVNWMTCMRPPSYVLEEWEHGYGITGLTGPAFQSYLQEVWNTLEVNDRESQRNISNEALWKGCAALGYREGPDYDVIQRDAVGCDERCAYCTFGCSYPCKRSTVMNYLPMAASHGAKFLFDASVDRIEVKDGKATGAEATWSSGGKKAKVTIRSKVVVAACGAIHTPVLLLKSGIGNRNVGRFLRIHPTTVVAGRFEGMSGPWAGPPQTVAVRKFIDQDSTKHGFWIEAVPAHPGLFALASPWLDGRSHKEFMAQNYSHSAATIVLVREWGNGTVKVDKHGSPSVSYALDSRDIEYKIKGIQETARILAAAGSTQIWSFHSRPAVARAESGAVSERELDPFFDEVRKRGVQYNSMLLGSAHLMGSCRMSADESTGATNPRGELYGVKNLFIGDASVFPTAPGVNPMITIMAMARRTAESIKSELQGG